LFSTYQWVNRIYEFNQYERDQWVANRAREIPGGSRVLDAGAGSCPYRSLFAHCDYRTQDFAQLDSDQLRGQRGYGGIDYVCDICNIPEESGTFDVVLCTEVLEHVAEPIRAVGEFARLLKPGGKLLLTAPLGSGLHQEPYHFYGGFTPQWYRKFLTEAGFEQIVVEANGGFFKHFGQESIRFAKILAPWQGLRQGLFIRLPFWLIFLPFAVIIPIWAYWGDSLDRKKAFTVGYHITGVRCP